MTEDNERPAAWLDYLIASDDPDDQAMCKEYRALAWENGQRTQWMLADPTRVTQELFDAMEDHRTRSTAFQKRVHARALALEAEDRKPAKGEKLDSWWTEWRKLAQTHPDHDAPPPSEA
jgi:hypothetical protein